jgi:hypothetical protein
MGHANVGGDARDGHGEGGLESRKQLQLLIVLEAIRRDYALCPLDRFQRVGDSEHRFLEALPQVSGGGRLVTWWLPWGVRALG